MALLYSYEQLYSNGKLVKRPSRSIKSPYIADIIIDEKEELAHCPSLGISGLLNDEAKFLCSKNETSTRKSKYTVELTYLPSTLNTTVLTNTNPQFGNKLFASIIKNNIIDEYKNPLIVKSEKKYKDSRFDFYIKKADNKEEYIEVKSVVLCNFDKKEYPKSVKNPEIHRLNTHKKGAIFPDGFRKNKNVPISERAIKHLKTLVDCKKNNYDASLYFIVQRDDCDYFKPSDVDQFYSKELENTIKEGVNVKAISVKWTVQGECYFNKIIPVII